jgi:hypothetical protein
MRVATWVYHAITFLPFLGLIYFNSEIAAFVHSRFESSNTFIGDVVDLSGIVAGLLWLLINERLDLSEQAYVFIHSRQDPLEYAEGAEGYSEASWERFSGAPATQFSMLQLPGETNKSEEFSTPGYGVLLALLDIFFVCVPKSDKYSLNIDYANENNLVLMTLSEGDVFVYINFSELEESESLFRNLSPLSTEEERSRYLKISLAATTSRVWPEDVLITGISDQSFSGIRGISYDARVTKPEDQALFYHKRSLHLEINKRHYEIELYVDDDACSEGLLAFSNAILRAVVVRQGVFLGQYAAFR